MTSVAILPGFMIMILALFTPLGLGMFIVPANRPLPKWLIAFGVICFILFFVGAGMCIGGLLIRATI